METDRAVEQKTVADGREGSAGSHQVALDTEQVRVLTLHEQTARIVCKIAQPRFELPRAQQEFVIISAGKEQAVGAVLAAAVPWFGLLR